MPAGHHPGSRDPFHGRHRKRPSSHRQYEELQRAERIGRELNELLFRHASLAQLLAKVAEIVDNPVVLEDPAHQVVAHASSASDISSVLSDWDAHSRRGHGTARTEAETSPDLRPTDCLWVPILLRGETWGRLHVLPIHSPADARNLLVMDRAAAAIGIALLGERDAANIAEHARGALIDEALEGSLRTPEGFVVTTGFYLVRRHLGNGQAPEAGHIAPLIPEHGRPCLEQAFDVLLGAPAMVARSLAETERPRARSR